MKRASLLIVAAVSCLAALPTRQSQAAIFVGKWEVDQGPSWTTNPPVYSGQEAAALLFGGSPSDYLISTVDSNPLNIDRMAWYSVITVSGGMKFADDYHHDVGLSGYNTGDFTASNSDVSAYVNDNAMGAQYTNYAFSVKDTVDGPSPAVPEPASLAIWALGALGCTIAGFRRRKKA